jgi:uncharacterized protein (TIGR01777 family)
MRVAVAGGTGLIGRQVCRALAARGDELTILTRHPERSGRTGSPSVRVVGWDAVGSLPSEGLSDVDAVINLVGEPITGLWTSEKKRRIRESRIESTRRLVEALANFRDQTRVLVNASASGYYGDRGDETLAESAPAGQDFLASVCQEWEGEAAKAEGYGVRVVRVRSGVVLDARGGFLAVMAPAFRAGLGSAVGRGTQWLPWIHIADEAALFLHAIDHTEVSGPLNAAAPEPATNAEFSRALADALGRPLRLRAPGFLVRLGLGEAADLLLNSARLAPQKALDTGFRFEHPSLSEALGALLVQSPT